MTSSKARRVRLPRSAPSRKHLTFAILIHRVFAQRSLGDAFQGKVLRPGATVNESDLWPEPDYPAWPLLLEYAGSDRAINGIQRDRLQTYICWRYNPEDHAWAEIARAAAVGIEWVEILKPVALRFLTNTNPARIAAAAEAAARLLCQLDSELEPLESGDRLNLLGMLYEQLTARLVRDDVVSANGVNHV